MARDERIFLTAAGLVLLLLVVGFIGWSGYDHIQEERALDEAERNMALAGAWHPGAREEIRTMMHDLQNGRYYDRRQVTKPDGK